MTDTVKSLDRRRRFVDTFHNPLTARLILAAAVALTAAAWYFSHTIVDNAAHERFDSRTKEIESAIADRMFGYEHVLWGGAGLFNASDHVSRQEWGHYVASLDIYEHWPGIQGIGFAVPVPAEGVDDHVSSIRAEGFPDYRINPEGTRDGYTAIIYLEPFDWRNQRAFGFDMWSDDIRRTAMTRARDTGKASTSGVITLVQETDEDVQRGFLTYVPVYRHGSEPTNAEERQAAFVGWIYAAFRMNDLMDGILGHNLDDVDYEIFDGFSAAEDLLLFDSNETVSGPGASESKVERTTTVSMQGRPWTVVFQPSPEFWAANSDGLPTTVAIAGLIIDLLLFYAINSLGRISRRATTIAEERTAELEATTERLKERTQELEERAVELKRSNAELEQFAYVASHDLQEPLRTMGSYSALLDQKYSSTLPTEATRWLGYVVSGSERLSLMIRELLEFSTVGADSAELAPVALEDALESALLSLSDAIADAGVVIDRAPLPTVIGNHGQLERLLQNLLTNAVKYRREGVSPRVTISVDQGEREWRIAVQDNGIGIKPEYQDRIFEIFRRVGSRKDYPGTGIGLAICRKIVENHNGSIGVNSHPDQGSEFWFTLPVAYTRRAELPTIEPEPALADA